MTYTLVMTTIYAALMVGLLLWVGKGMKDYES